MAGEGELDLKVAIISRETIKPSSPTPPGLRNFKLSLLDQYVPPDQYAPLLLFFPGSDNTTTATIDDDDKSQRLRSSLSEILTRFYPFAGRLNGDSTAVDCNDQGVCYSEARIDCSLPDVLTDVRYDQIKRLFIPSRSANWGSGADALLFVQVTFFQCGGMAVVTLVSHNIADATTIYAFTKAWASAAGGRPDAVVPDFSVGSLFPIKHALAMTRLPEPVKGVTRRFVFDTSKIAALKLKAASNKVQHPSRVQAVSSLLWKCSIAAAAASRSKSGSRSPRETLLTWPVNIRSKMVPPLSEYSMGNVIVFQLIKGGKNIDEKDDLGSFICQLKDGFTEFNNKYVSKLRQGNAETVIVDMFIGYGKEMAKAGQHVDAYLHSSACKLGIYEIDFGWGKPTWAAFVVGHDGPNVVVLTDTFDGKGIEAQVNLLEEEMAFLEHDPELLEFASVNPSPLLQQSKSYKVTSAL